MRLLIIFMLAAASLPAQNLKFKVKQLPKDTSVGRVVLSSLTDSTMTYSDLLKIDNDSLYFKGSGVLTSAMNVGGGLSSVLSDGVTITGDGTSGNELTVDTSVIATQGDLSDYVTIAGTETITGAKTFTSDIVVQNEETNTNAAELNLYKKNGSSSGDVTVGDNIGNINFKAENGATTVTSASIEVDATTVYNNEIGGDMVFKTASEFHSRPLTEAMRIDKLGNISLDSTLFVDATNNRVGIGTSSPQDQLHLSNSGLSRILVESTGGTSAQKFIETNVSGQPTGMQWVHGSSGTQGLFELYATNESGGPTGAGGILSILHSSGNVGIGTTSPSEKLDVNGKVKIQDLTSTGGNAVYENGGVLGVASDARFKTYVGDIVNGIELINQLKPKYFIDNRNSSFQQLGFYAQEVKSVINEASYPIGDTDYLGINDRAILATTVKAIQEQQAIIENLQAQIDELKQLINK